MYLLSAHYVSGKVLVAGVLKIRHSPLPPGANNIGWVGLPGGVKGQRPEQVTSAVIMVLHWLWKQILIRRESGKASRGAAV